MSQIQKRSTKLLFTKFSTTLLVCVIGVPSKELWFLFLAYLLLYKYQRNCVGNRNPMIFWTTSHDKETSSTLKEELKNMQRFGDLTERVCGDGVSDYADWNETLKLSYCWRHTSIALGEIGKEIVSTEVRKNFHCNFTNNTSAYLWSVYSTRVIRV